MKWEVGGRFNRKWTYVCLWLIHGDVWQKPAQYCEAIILQLKINKFFLKKEKKIKRLFCLILEASFLYMKYFRLIRKHKDWYNEHPHTLSSEITHEIQFKFHVAFPTPSPTLPRRPVSWFWCYGSMPVYVFVQPVYISIKNMAWSLHVFELYQQYCICVCVFQTDFFCLYSSDLSVLVQVTLGHWFCNYYRVFHIPHLIYFPLVNF